MTLLSDWVIDINMKKVVALTRFVDWFEVHWFCLAYCTRGLGILAVKQSMKYTCCTWESPLTGSSSGESPSTGFTSGCTGGQTMSCKHTASSTTQIYSLISAIISLKFNNEYKRLWTLLSFNILAWTHNISYLCDNCTTIICLVKNYLLIKNLQNNTLRWG